MRLSSSRVEMAVSSGIPREEDLIVERLAHLKPQDRKASPCEGRARVQGGYGTVVRVAEEMGKSIIEVATDSNRQQTDERSRLLR